MATNPNPARISAEMWRFAEACLALDSNTVNAGIWGDKPGYHNTRNELIRDGFLMDYSIQLAADKKGPGDKGAAFDWTFRSAQSGNYARISTYVGRVAKAFRRRDPRLRGWREVLGQADLDAQPEGFDFVGWYTRVPDNTHQWHVHFSILREHIADWRVYANMLSILAGKAHTPMLGLVQGDESDEVEYLQTMLTSAGFPVAIDGKYGAATSAKLLELRKSLGSTATSGTSVTPSALEQIHRAHVIKRAPTKPGPVGPAGPAGPAGPPGPSGPAVGSTIQITGTVVAG